MVRGRSFLVVGLSVAVAAGAVAAAGDVAAAPRKPTKAARRFEKKGKKAYARRRWDDAIAAFKLAYGADPHPRFLYNTSRAYDKKGDLESAIDYLVRYLEEETDAEELADGQAELQIMEQRLQESHAPLDLTAKPGEAKVVLEGGGRQLTMSTPVSRWLRAGAWKLRVSAPGYEDWERALVVEAGVPLELAVRLKEEGSGAAPAAEPEAEPDPEPEPVAGHKPATPARPPPDKGGGGSPVPWLALGGGAALLAGGAVFGMLAVQARDERDALKGTDPFHDEIEARQQEAEGRALVANVLLGAGGVAVVAGVVLLLVGGDEPDAASAEGLRLVPPAGGGGLVLEGSF